MEKNSHPEQPTGIYIGSGCTDATVTGNRVSGYTNAIEVHAQRAQVADNKVELDAPQKGRWWKWLTTALDVITAMIKATKAFLS